MHKLLVVFFALGLAACSREGASPSQPASQPRADLAVPAGLTRVTDTSQVCMVNDQFMGRPQIPIAVDGRTYYGCCAMCKDRLANEPSTRTATDPVTGEQVDKARAVIAQDAAGKVLYFASEDTLRRYQR